MPISKLRPTFTLTEDRLKELQAVVPEAFADGRINWDTLREALGETLEDEAQEHFGLFWPGKREARRLAAMPSKGTLIPQPGAGVDEENTHNLFIEGDNLEVLKLLQKSYAGRVKMIYIDPPYNTGNDYVYPDDYSEPLEAYLERTGQVDEAGQLLTTNSRASGRFHSNWLNMIYPRLVLARQLLRDDGSILVSIDDNEVQHLRMVMNEIFGEENFITQIEWQKRYTRSNNTDGFTSVIEHVVLYRKTEAFEPNLFPRDEEADARYTNPDNDSRGSWKLIPFSNPLSPEQRPNLNYPIVNPNTGEKIMPQAKAWRASKDVFERYVKENRIWWGKDGKSKNPGVKRFLSEVKQGMTPINFWDYEFAGHTDIANNEIKTLFGSKVFDTPKPTLLIRRMLQLCTEAKSEDLVLDFFAGSCSTAHAVLDQNIADGSKRRFILVQIPEKTPSDSPAYVAGYKTISSIGKDRIKKVIKKIKTSDKGKFESVATENLGLSIFTLTSSHFNEWQPFSGKDTSQLELRFGESETPLVEDWKPENLLAEILLLQGFPLDSKVRSLPEFKANDVQQVASEFIGHHLYICLDKKVKVETVAKINLRPEDILVCLDSALSDEAKVKLADQCNLKVI